MPERLVPVQASHRGAFGEFGGESRGLIDRTFRERIVLAGVVLGRDDPDRVDASMKELAQLVDTAGAYQVASVLQPVSYTHLTLPTKDKV